MTDPQRLLRQLADLTPGTLPLMSIYLDMRLYVGGENLRARSGLVVLRERLRAIEKTFPHRGPAIDSFRADVSRLDAYLARDFGPEVHGLALFASAGRDLFEALEADMPFENAVAVGADPDLFQLSWLIDGLETALVALVDTGTARLFIARRGSLQPLGGFADGPHYYGTREVGRWSQAYTQRHDDGARALFARQFPHQVAEELDRLVARTGAAHVILAGEAVAIPRLRDVLSPRVADLVYDGMVRIDTRAPQDTVRDAIDPLLATLEADDALAVADRLIGAIRADGLGMAGRQETHLALEQGQVATLLLDPAAELSDEARSELVRLAARSNSAVEIVAGHEAFGRLGGVGALLRYRSDAQPKAAVGIDPAPARRHSVA